MDTVILKAKTRGEVADEYGIKARTFYRWLKKANIKLPSGLIKPCDLQIIYNTFGIPKILKTP
jgi:DNA invertase Pin-like site-specific DNA recombinase